MRIEDGSHSLSSERFYCYFYYNDAVATLLLFEEHVRARRVHAHVRETYKYTLEKLLLTHNNTYCYIDRIFDNIDYLR